MAESMINFTYPIGEKSIGGFVIDAFLVESYNYENRVTNLYVEEGGNISEHVIESPDTLEIEAFIGATKFEAFTGTFVDDLSNVEIPEDPKSRIRQAHQELLRLKREKQPLDIVTGLDTLTDMVITSYNFNRDVDSGFDLPFSMSFQKVKSVKSEETQISTSPSSSASGSGDQAAGTANVGTAGTSQVQEENAFKERWRQWVRSGQATREDFFEQWGHYP